MERLPERAHRSYGRDTPPQPTLQELGVRCNFGSPYDISSLLRRAGHGDDHIFGEKCKAAHCKMAAPSG